MAACTASHGRSVCTRLVPGTVGCFRKKRTLGLNVEGMVGSNSGLALIGALRFVTVHPFLAATHRVDSSILVVEGWVHDYVIRAAAKEFSAGDYQRVFSTGGPSAGSGGYTWDADTSASVGAGQLRAAGIPSILVQMVTFALHWPGSNLLFSSCIT